MASLPVIISKDFDKYFFNRNKEREQINTILSLLEKDIANQILITGCRGVGKTFLLKKIVKEQPSKYLTCYIDLSKTYNGQQGKLTEEEVIKEFLNKINSKATVSKYISLLNNKGILELNNKKYVLTDRMLKTWLKNKKKIEGQYPE